MNRSTPSALAGLRVLEIAEMVSGPYCGKLLGDLGAEVIKVEPPSGDPARREGPFPGDGEEDPEASALFLYNNTSKRAIVIDLDSADGRAELARLVEWAEVLIDNHPRSFLEERGWSWDELHAANPRLVYTSITPYGRTGPRRDLGGDELTLIQAGGLGNLLPTRSADVDRAPVKLGGRQVAYHGGSVAALATLAAVYGCGSRSEAGRADDGGGEAGRGADGPGRMVDVSLQEVVLALVAPNVAGNRYHGTTWSRVPDRPPAMGRLRTRDGYVILNAFDDHHFAVFRELLGNPAWCAGDEWLSMTYRARHLLEFAPQIEEWALDQEKHALHREVGARGIPIGPINDARDVLASAQYEARGYFVDVEHSRAGGLRYPGWPYQMSASPPRVSRPAPQLDEHGAAVRIELTEATPAKRGAAAPAPKSTEQPLPKGTEQPLAGVRVLEFCWVWAGPYAGMLLGSLGAEVIKVEGHKRSDLTRRSVVWPLADAQPSSVPPNRGMAFNSVNMNKRALSLDLAQPEGVALARRLAARSDVVADNMRPGALGKLGLGYQDLRQLREDIIVGSSSGRGHVGPERELLGYAMIHQGIGGGAHITGYPDDHPCHSGGDVDLMNAVAFAFAIVAALHHRRRTGEGQFIDYSQCEGVTSLLGEVLLGYQMTGRLPERAGNRHERYAPHNVYRAWGVDRWIAIEVHSDAEFVALCGAIARPELTSDPRFATASARKSNESELDAILGAWTRERDRDWMVAHLERAGVTVAPSRDGRDLYADPHLRARSAFVEVAHPELGPLELVTAPWKLSGWTMPARPAPALGQDDDAILGELLGLDEREIAGLRERGVIAPSPVTG